MFNKAYQGKKVLITGNTGFMGAWLTILLRELGAEVIGYSLEAPTERNLFTRAGLEKHITQISGDVRTMAFIAQTLVRHKPDFIFHLAAQSSPVEAYRDPVETFEVNVMGSVALMEAVRQAKIDVTVIMVTADNVYEDQDWSYGYRENDQLGGKDPYSASKTAMEMAVAAFAGSFFSAEQGAARVATVRSGKVIGGGDWRKNRIVPDAVRALAAGEKIELHNPRSTYPWQHVLEPLTGYLWLAAVLAHRRDFAGAWNFGPMMTSHKSARIMIERLISEWGDGDWIDVSGEGDRGLEFTEPPSLKLNIEKSQEQLSWRPVWNFRQAIARTAEWYKQDLSADDPSIIYALCEVDIEIFMDAASAMRLPYTRK